MKTNRFWFWVMTLLAITVLSACGSRSSEGQITEQPLNVNSVWFRWTSLPVDALAGATQEEIADKLFSLYLEQFKDESTDKSIRLVDYNILTIIPIIISFNFIAYGSSGKNKVGNFF